MVLERFKRRIKPICLLVTVLVISYVILAFMTNQINNAAFQKVVAERMDVSRLMTDTLRSSKHDAMNLQRVCADTNNKELEEFFGEIHSNMSVWTFRERVKCNTHDIGNQFAFKARRKLLVECFQGSANVAYWWTFNSSDVLTFEYGDPCLSIYVKTCCGIAHRIPNVVHYVWYRRGIWTFVPFLSTLSVLRFVKPCAIIFHGELPTGPYWDAITYFSPNIILLKRQRPESIFGKRIKYKTHSSDIMRLEALSEYGGIYMDTDTIIVKPLENLMDYPFVLSNQTSRNLGSAFIMSERNASFLQLWLNEYKIDYRPENYTYNAMKSTKMLAENETNKDLIHVEYGTISRPTGMLNLRIFVSKYANHDWSYIYGIHTFIRIYQEIVNETTIRNMSSIFGSVCRHVFYGDKELCY